MKLAEDRGVRRGVCEVDSLARICVKVEELPLIVAPGSRVQPPRGPRTVGIVIPDELVGAGCSVVAGDREGVRGRGQRLEARDEGLHRGAPRWHWRQPWADQSTQPWEALGERRDGVVAVEDVVARLEPGLVDLRRVRVQKIAAGQR